MGAELRGSTRITDSPAPSSCPDAPVDGAATAPLRLDDDPRTQPDTLVDVDDVGVPHADTPVAHGATEQLRVRPAMDADRPSLTVREPDPALAERVRRPRRDPLGDLRRERSVDLDVLRVHDHLLDLVAARGGLQALAPDRD